MDGKEITRHEIAFQQVLLADGSVFSIQWTIIPESHAAPLSPAFLVERYLAYIRRFTLSVIRPVITAAGIEFRLLHTGLSLLNFAGPLYSAKGSSATATLSICGGLLVQSAHCDRGQLSFSTEATAAGVKVTLQLGDYCPLLLGSLRPSRLRKLLYRFTQAYIHRIVVLRFLALLWRELVGSDGRIRIIRVRVRDGEPT